MVALRQAIAGVVREFACSALSQGQDSASWLGTARSGVIGAGLAGGSAGLSAGLGVIQGIACSEGQSGGGGAGASFPPSSGATGGQCDALYTINYTVDIVGRTSGQVEQVRDGQRNSFRGPIAPLELVDNGTIATIRESTGEGRSVVRGGNRFSEWTNLRNVVYTIEGDIPDDCGDAPGAGGGTSVPTGGGDLTYDTPDGPRTVPYDIVGGAPVVTGDGAPQLCFNVLVEGSSITVCYDLSSGDVSISVGGGPGGSNCCPPTDGPEDEPPDLPPGTPPEPDEQPPFIGVVVRAVNIPDNFTQTTVNSGTGPDLYIPRIGSIRFAVKANGQRGWTKDYDIKSAVQYIPLPPGVTGYRFDLIPVHPWDLVVKVLNVSELGV